MLQRAAFDEERLNRDVDLFEGSLESGEHVDELKTSVVITASGAPLPHEFRLGFRIADMKRSGFISKEGDRWHVNTHLKRTLDEFIQFLEIKRAA